MNPAPLCTDACKGNPSNTECNKACVGVRLYSPAFTSQSSVLACNLLLSCFHMISNIHLQMGTAGSILGNTSLEENNK